MPSPTARNTAYRYPLMLLAGAVLISFSSVYVKIAQVSPSVSGFYRMFFGGIVLLALVILRQQFHRVDRRVMFLMVVCSIWFAADLFFWHRSILYVGPGLSTLLANFQVFLLAGVGVIWFGERLSVRLVCAIGWDVSFFQRQVTGANMIGLVMAIAGIYLGTAASGPAKRP
jgi:drug/metabolite transporter (DMT)-like permease